jgi:hypothetical protein
MHNITNCWGSTCKVVGNLGTTLRTRGADPLEPINDAVEKYKNDEITFAHVETGFRKIIDRRLSPDNQIILYGNYIEDSLDVVTPDKRANLLSLLAFGAVSENKTVQFIVCQALFKHIPDVLRELADDESIFNLLDADKTRADLSLSPSSWREQSQYESMDSDLASRLFLNKLHEALVKKGDTSGADRYSQPRRQLLGAAAAEPEAFDMDEAVA